MTLHIPNPLMRESLRENYIKSRIQDRDTNKFILQLGIGGRVKIDKDTTKIYYKIKDPNIRKNYFIELLHKKLKDEINKEPLSVKDVQNNLNLLYGIKRINELLKKYENLSKTSLYKEILKYNRDRKMNNKIKTIIKVYDDGKLVTMQKSEQPILLWTLINHEIKI